MIIKAIAITKFLIGLLTLLGLITYFLLFISKKPLNVFAFILISSLLSILIGIGLFYRKEWARKTLIFFSGYIVPNKITISSNPLHFIGEIITCIPSGFKNFISILYHNFIIILFSRYSIKRCFDKR